MLHLQKFFGTPYRDELVYLCFPCGHVCKVQSSDQANTFLSDTNADIKDVDSDSESELCSHIALVMDPTFYSSSSTVILISAADLENKNVTDTVEEI